MSVSPNICIGKRENTQHVDSTTQSERVTRDFLPTLSTIPQSSERNLKTHCKHPAHQHLRTSTLSKLLPAEHWAAHGLQQVDENEENSIDAEHIHRDINEAFIKRIQELETKAPSALEAKLETYKDWVSVLQRLNKLLFNDFNEFERALEQHLKLNESHSNLSYRRDVASLVRLIRQAHHHNNWSLVDMKFETVTPAEILGLDENNPHDKETLANLLKGEDSHTNKTSKKQSTEHLLKALTEEVAERHDEIRKLKQDITSLEEEIKNAQQKIQLKDDVIQNLRLDLKNCQKEILTKSSFEMPPVNMESLAETFSKEQKRMASYKAEECGDMLKPCTSKTFAAKVDSIENRLHEVLNTPAWRSDCSTKETHGQREIFIKLESERIEACQRLDKIRDGLLNLLPPKQPNELQMVLRINDEMLLGAISEHIENIIADQIELNEQVKNLLIEKGTLAGELKALKKMNKNCSEALRELADLLSSMTGESFNYNEIYDANSSSNPFCQAICCIKVKFSEDIGELKAQLEQTREKLESLEAENRNLKEITEEAQTKSNVQSNKTTAQATTVPQKSKNVKSTVCRKFSNPLTSKK